MQEVVYASITEREAAHCVHPVRVAISVEPFLNQVVNRGVVSEVVTAIVLSIDQIA